MKSIVHPSWYALTVKSKYEQTVAKALAYKRLEPFLPCWKEKRRWSDRVKLIELPLFTGYVFCRFPLSERLAVLTTPGVRSIVSLGKQPEAVSDDELDAIRTMVSSGFPVQPWPFLRQGQTVVIRRGPLQGLRGRLAQSPETWQVVVNVELLRRSVAVTLDREALELVRQPGEETSASSLATAACGDHPWNRS